MNQDLLKSYADLKIEEKAVQEKIKELQPQVLAEMEAAKADEVTTDFGKFTLGHRRTYTYPPEIQTVEVQLKEQKKEAEAKGLATYTEKTYVVFKKDGAEGTEE